MRVVLVMVAVASCGRPPPKVDVDPATPAQAKAFAAQLIAAAKPGCDDKMTALVDHDALAAKTAEHTATTGREHDVIADVIRRRHSGVRVLCSWLGTDAQLKLMGSEGTHPVLRKIARAPGAKASGVAYYSFELGVSRADATVHVLDAYSYLEGAWLTEILGQVVGATIESGVTTAFSVRDTMDRIKKLAAEHEGAKALAQLATLPESLRKMRYIQIMGVGLARMVSEQAYLKALDDLARERPNDPAVAMIEIDGALLHGDYDRALALVDVIDKAVGGDPFQDAIRSNIYLEKHDLVQAAAHADAAIAAEPTLQKAWYARLDVALAREDWGQSLATIDQLAKLGAKLTDAGMRGVHVFDGLVASPDYAAWLKAHATP